MLLYVFNKNGTLYRKIKGNYDNGLFIYYDNPGILNKGEPHKIPLNYNDTYLGIDKKNRVAFGLYNGKDINQTTIENTIKTEENTKFIDFQKDFKVLDLTKKRMLTEPRNSMKSIIEFLTFAIIIFSLIGLYLEVSHFSSVLNPIIQTQNKTLNLISSQYKIEANQTSTLINIIKNIPSTNTTIPFR